MYIINIPLNIIDFANWIYDISTGYLTTNLSIYSETVGNYLFTLYTDAL